MVHFPNALRKEQLYWQKVPERRSGVQKSISVSFQCFLAQFDAN